MKVFLHLFFPFHWKLHLMIEFFFTKPPSPPPFSQFCPFIFCFFVAIHNCPFPCFCFYSNITFIFPIGNSRFLRYSFFFSVLFHFVCLLTSSAYHNFLSMGNLSTYSSHKSENYIFLVRVELFQDVLECSFFLLFYSGTAMLNQHFHNFSYHKFMQFY